MHVKKIEDMTFTIWALVEHPNMENDILVSPVLFGKWLKILPTSEYGWDLQNLSP